MTKKFKMAHRAKYCLHIIARHKCTTWHYIYSEVRQQQTYRPGFLHTFSVFSIDTVIFHLFVVPKPQVISVYLTTLGFTSALGETLC